MGTVYLGRMPEPGQGTLSRQLTALIEAVLRGWAGPLPRLAYITDGGNHQTRYYRRVLRRMSDPHHPGRRLEWEWVIDYYHACEYITKLSEALFSDARAGASWARKMRRWLKEKPRGIYRVLHSAAALRRRRIIASAAKREQYRTAYDYLRKRMRLLDYCGYRRDHLPIGSGVTEAACKTVFTQRLKQSGMTWKVEGGQWIVDLRVIHLSGVWSEVYQSYLGSKATLEMGTQGTTAKGKASKAATPFLRPRHVAVLPIGHHSMVTACRPSSRPYPVVEINSQPLIPPGPGRDHQGVLAPSRGRRPP